MGVQGTKMNIEEKINKIVKTNKGYVTRRNIDENNIPSIYLSRYVKKYNLKQIVRGFYATNDWIVDSYSAIYLHGLGDILPNYLEVTGPFNYRPMSKNRDDIITHTDTVDKTYNLGIIDAYTTFGNVIRVYDKEKTICDLIKNKDKIEFEVYVKALNNYAKSKDKNINKLMEYARIMKIEDRVRSQMEVILNAD